MSQDELPPAPSQRAGSHAGSRPVTPVSVHSRPHTPTTPLERRPHTPTTPIERGRTLSPVPPGTRSRSVSPLGRRKAKVNPTDAVLPPAELESKPVEGKCTQSGGCYSVPQS